MEPLILILLCLTCLAVLGVLLLGIISMLKGGEFNKKYGNTLMRLRVAFQAASLLLLASLWFVS